MRSCINGATTMPYGLEDDIRSAAEAGFEGVEIWVGKLRKYLETHSKADLKRLLDEAGVEAPCLCAFGGFVFCSGDDYERRVEELRRFLDVGSSIGTECIVVCAEGLGGLSFSEAKERYVERLSSLAEVVEEYGVKIALEWFEELPQAVDIISAIESEYVGLLIDTFHWYRGDGRLESLELVPGDRLVFVHINDCEDLPREVLRDSNRLFCGEGVIPLVEVLRTFKRKGYEGFLSVEIFREEYWGMPPTEIAKRALKSLLEVASKAGVTVSTRWGS